jgi:hypothetical protein
VLPISNEGAMTMTQDQIVLKDEERTRCEVWTRVMGYHRPVAGFNVGKKGEFYERKYFIEPKEAGCSCS